MHVVAAGAERTRSQAVHGGLLINSEYSPLLALKLSIEGFQSYVLPFLSSFLFYFSVVTSLDHGGQLEIPTAVSCFSVLLLLCHMLTRLWQILTRSLDHQQPGTASRGI